jgi:hypothetical protein
MDSRSRAAANRAATEALDARRVRIRIFLMSSVGVVFAGIPRV